MQLETRRNRLNFISFTKLMVESRTISFYHRSRTIGEVKGNAVVNWIFFIMMALALYSEVLWHIGLFCVTQSTA